MNEENQKMLDHCVEYATDLLKEQGESYPFGAFIDTIGNVHPLEMEVDKKNTPTIGKVIETLEKYCVEEMNEKRMTGYALTYEVEIALSENETKDCIAIDIKHKDEETPLFYLPFTKSDLGVGVQEIFAVKR